MIRFHLMIALVAFVGLLFEEVKTDEKDDCFNYGKQIENDTLTVGDIAENCVKGKTCYRRDFKYIRCFLVDKRSYLLYERITGDRVFAAVNLEMYANPDKYESLETSVTKCENEEQTGEIFYDCLLDDMKEICPNDKYFKVDEGCEYDEEEY